ncbi:PhzF family phenazine biosynthesis protein [Salinivibrio sp. SS2]|uniref:PhzF family phenazine biosynthesis protein n=1 Tax=Salinivibrio sp. SS2 TaxID=1892894 RepID=UPI000AC4A68C|nr:PhzF family phenazine biosynthesis protein [Salinivibrio sp. DV]
MMDRFVEFYHLNAFVAQGQGGNPAGVVRHADMLDDAQMQAIATDFGYPETAFICHSEHADIRLRFFTPTNEVAFCGHATVATFSALWQLGELEAGDYTQETGAGVLQVSILDSGKVNFETAIPVISDGPNEKVIADAFHIDSKDILSTGLPVKVVSAGGPNIILPLASLDALARMSQDREAVIALTEAYDCIGVHAFALSPHESDITACCRNFAPAVGVDEEAATGSAAAALAAYLTEYQGTHNRFVFEQGEHIGARSLLSAVVKVDGQGHQRAWVGGEANTLARRGYRLDAISA